MNAKALFSTKELVEQGVLSEVEGDLIEDLYKFAHARYQDKPLVVPFMEAARGLMTGGQRKPSLEVIVESIEAHRNAVYPALGGVMILEALLVDIFNQLDAIREDQQRIMNLVDILCDDKERSGKKAH